MAIKLSSVINEINQSFYNLNLKRKKQKSSESFEVIQMIELGRQKKLCYQMVHAVMFSVCMRI